MKIDNGKYKFEKRRKRLFLPIIYMLAEIVLVYLILAMVNVSFQIQTWGALSYLLLFVVASYSGYKTYLVYYRQKEYKLA